MIPEPGLQKRIEGMALEHHDGRETTHPVQEFNAAANQRQTHVYLVLDLSQERHQ